MQSKYGWVGISLVFVLLMAGTVLAQDSVTVPDLSGLKVPQAAAALNQVGLRLGAETSIGWTETSGLPGNTISAQSLAGGSTAERGATVDVTVLRSPNAILIYDDNDLTLVNRTGGELNLAALLFTALDGSPASFAATRWAGALRTGQCVQVWSVGRNGPKGLDECLAIQNWLVTNNSGEHFWTGAGGRTRFALLQNGVTRAECPVSQAGRCEFYLDATSTGSETTDYVYFAYTTDRLAIINTAEDRWMGLAGFQVYNFNTPSRSALAAPVGDPSLFGNPPIPGRTDLLAPGQCLLFTRGQTVPADPPQPCDVIARLAISPELIFWGAAFELGSSDGVRRSCPAAIEGRLTLCVMPR